MNTSNKLKALRTELNVAKALNDTIKIKAIQKLITIELISINTK